jgi:hypothetical protein
MEENGGRCRRPVFSAHRERKDGGQARYSVQVTDALKVEQFHPLAYTLTSIIGKERM